MGLIDQKNLAVKYALYSAPFTWEKIYLHGEIKKEERNLQILDHTEHYYHAKY
jgi:hypothetical protein